jgi:hypothetical protein
VKLRHFMPISIVINYVFMLKLIIAKISNIYISTVKEGSALCNNV